MKCVILFLVLTIVSTKGKTKNILLFDQRIFEFSVQKVWDRVCEPARFYKCRILCAQNYPSLQLSTYCYEFLTTYAMIDNIRYVDVVATGCTCEK